MNLTIDQLRAAGKGMLPDLFGIELLSADKDLVRAELFVRDDLCTTPGTMHGGAIMAFADNLGAYGTVLNLPPGAGTTTLESKTNFFTRAPAGEKVVGECRPLHRGRRTMVWETRVLREDGKLVARVTQTQIVLAAEPTAQESLARAFAGGETMDHQATLAVLERSGGAMYRAWAEQEADPDARAQLLEAAEREDRNAEVLEALVARRS